MVCQNLLTHVIINTNNKLKENALTAGSEEFVIEIIYEPVNAYAIPLAFILYTVLDIS